MRQNHGHQRRGRDSLLEWAEELRNGLVEAIRPGRVAEVAAVAGAAVVASSALASAAGAVAGQGGIKMSIGQAIASSTGLKLATGGLAALALGGGAMATGNLACEVPTEVEGNLLVETGLDGSADASVEQRTIEVEGLGLVDVAHSDVAVEVLGIRLEEGASAEVRSQGEDTAEIDFTLDGVTRTIVVSVVGGDLFASLAPTMEGDVAVSGDAAVEAEADANAGADLGIDVDADTDGEIDLSTDVGVDGDIDVSSDFDSAGETSILGSFGIGGEGGILGGFGLDADAGTGDGLGLGSDAGLGDDLEIDGKIDG